MKHVAPHRWADAWTGELPDGEVAAMERHAASCARCAKARDRITRASSQTFPALRAQSSPDIAWDAVRARVHWSLSSTRRAKPKVRPRFVAWLAGAAVVAGGAAVWLHSSARHDEPVPVAARAPVPHVAPRPVVGLVSRLAGDVLFDGLALDARHAFERRIAAGAVLATGEGRVDVQFGDASALSLGAASKLEVRRFDAEQIELAVDGTVDIEVAPRAAGQRFVVIAGGETVEVRGTQFRVVRDAAGVHVACRHGQVAVRDGSGELEVAAARAAFVHTGAAAADVHAEQMSGDDLAQLAAATPVTIPAWRDVDAAASGSTALEIGAVARRAVRVDGVELGEAPLHVRVLPGRHTVEAADHDGHYRRAGWVDTAADKPARLDVRGEPVAAPATPSAAERQRQLHAGIAAHRTQLARCTRAMTKAGVTGLAVDLELGVTATGDVDHLNVDSDLPAATRSCIEDVLHDVRFGPGSAAEWREKLPL
ncbi:MAG TPA: FecR family protein [Kofleriaceae bacterium]|jgi:hypothetical protein